MRSTGFRWCMLIGAAALGGVAVYYFSSYVVVAIALGNSGLQETMQHSIRALWLSFAFQGLLIALLYALVAFRPRSVSREVIVLFGLLQLVESVLLFAFAGNRIVALLLVGAAAFVLVGSLLWPKALPPGTPPKPPVTPDTLNVDWN